MTYFQPSYIAGPTGSGKTSVAIELASRLDHPVAVINADAFQIYKGIEILAATPTAEEQEQIEHRLFGHYSADNECDAASFATLARQEINEVATRAIPIVVGGSGLYLKSITHGLAPTPPGDPDLREQLDLRSLEDLVTEYSRLDPDGATSTNLKNRRYVTRNLEICLLTGKPASEIKSSWQRDCPDLVGVFLRRDRQELYDRINRRTIEMFRSGVVDEIASLSAQPSATAIKAIGLREIQSLIAGEITEDECVATIQQITRRYAKRQETWFKREPQYRAVPCLETDSPSQIVDRILKIFPLSQLQSQIDLLPCSK